MQQPQDEEVSSKSEVLDQFFDSVSLIVQDGRMKDLGWYKYSKDDDLVSIWFSALYERWSVEYRKAHGQQQFTNRTILDLLKEMPYFVEDKKLVRISTPLQIATGIPRRCIVFKYSRLPEHIKSWF
jgi:hypothetical protein